LLLSALFLVSNPKNIWALLLTLSLSFNYYFDKMPFLFNHIFFQAFTNFFLLIIIISYVFATRVNYLKFKQNDSEFREKLFQLFAPALRISVVILYFYAVFQKLNTDYINVEVSCGIHMMEGIYGRLPIFPMNDFVKFASMWGILVLEIIIPILFLIQKTRTLMLFIGLVFHLLLALSKGHASVGSFSVMLYSFFFLFTPMDFTARLQDVLQQFFKQVLSGKNFYLFISAIFGVLAVIIFSFLYKNIITASFVAFLCWLLIISSLLSYIMLKYRLKQASSLALYRSPQPVLYIIPIIFFFNGLCPYLGIKTHHSFLMYSNLRVEGGRDNHFFIPANTKLTNLVSDLVTVKDSDIEPLEKYKNNSELALTYFEFRRIVSSHTSQHFFVKFNRGAEYHELDVKDGVSNYPELTTPLPWLQRKFLYFKPVSLGKYCPCEL
jgi:hypothetical protein